MAVVRAGLDQQIEAGRELLTQIDVHVFPQPGRADELDGQFRAWHNRNRTYLERAFTTKELSREYEGVFFGMIGGRETDLDRIRDIAHDLQRDINKLLDIRGRLDLYEPPAQRDVPQPQPAPARSHPVNVHIHGQVGQLNISDLIQHAEASIEQVDRRGEAQLADALRQLAAAIHSANEVAEDQREDALDAVAVLAEVGALPDEERGKMRGRVRGALAVIGDVVKLAPAIKQAWDAWGPTITDHMPRLPN